MSGRILGDRGECARCRNGVCLLNDVPAVLVRKIFEVFLRASLCGSRVTNACRWCSKYGHVAPALPKWARLAFMKRQFEIWAYPFWRPGVRRCVFCCQAAISMRCVSRLASAPVVALHDE